MSYDHTPNPVGAKRLRPEALDERKSKPHQPEPNHEHTHEHTRPTHRD